MKKISLACIVALLFSILFSHVVVADSGKTPPLTVPQLKERITDVEKKNIALTGTIAGACMSGCKIWVTEGEYKKGDPFVLVWAKDEAFKFKTDAAGQKVKLQGFAVGKYIDLCAGKEKEEEAKKEVKEGDTCPKPEALAAEKDKKLESITFFATAVEYL